MQTDLTQKEIKAIIISELPDLIKKDPDIRDYIIKITRVRYADKETTGERFDRILDELKRDREERSKRLQEEGKRWEAQERKWEVWERKWEVQERKWEAQNKRWDEESKKQSEKWAAWDNKWQENQQIIRDMMASIKALSTKYDSTIGALGTRRGIHSEQVFRNGLKSILEDSFGVKVERYEDFDHDGIVFGRPDQIEMDIIIRNGTLILCEIKSSMSKSEIYTFWRKKQFYEEKHEEKATRIMVISPMVEDSAKKVAKELGIEISSYAEDVKLPKRNKP